MAALTKEENMRNILLILLFCAAPAAAQDFSTATMRPITMGETYKLALQKSEALAIQAEGLSQLAAAEKSAAAAFRPAFDLRASHSKQQNSDAATKGYLYGSYNVFSGMRDYLAVKAAAAIRNTAAFDLERARQELYLSAAGAYLDLYYAQREALIRLEQMEVTARRITELEARAEIGRSRRSEVAAARSQLARDKADYLDAVSGERLAQQVLKFITGLEADLAPGALKAPPAGAPEEYRRLALKRPDVEARRRSAGAYGLLADIQDRNTWPSVDLSGNYYVLRSPMPSPENRWDGTLALTLPLYTGGQAGARRDSARSARAAAELSLRQAERLALTEVESAWQENVYAAQRADTLAEALVLASENARYQQEDYKLGLVTNLDVLNALNTVLQTRLDLARAEVQVRLTVLKLYAAAGLEVKQ
jgi:outer membrane protein